MLIGMGPGRLSGMSLEALNAAKTADVRRYEAYTALWPQAELDALEAEVGAIEKVMRPEVELPEALFELARTSLVALLCGWGSASGNHARGFTTPSGRSWPRMPGVPWRLHHHIGDWRHRIVQLQIRPANHPHLPIRRLGGDFPFGSHRREHAPKPPHTWPSSTWIPQARGLATNFR